MRSFKRKMTAGAVLLAMAFTACKKNRDVSVPGRPTDPVIPVYKNFIVNVKAVIGIGSLIYDSIPALLKVTSWDSLNNPHQKTISLSAGSNELALPGNHLRYKLELDKWGIHDEISFTKENMDEGTTISLGGTRAAKKLKSKEDFLIIQGMAQPEGKAVYIYNQSGNMDFVKYYQKKPQHSDLQLTITDRYQYTGNRVDRINHFDENNTATGFTQFEYTPQQKLVNMVQKRYDQETYGYIQYEFNGTRDIIKIDYLYKNGHAMEYSLEFLGGNKVKDNAASSTGGGEQGTYSYDFNINPYAHMNMPDIYLSNLSKNNLTGQEKSYSGSIPSGVPYKYEYVYDMDGYPVELLRSYKSYMTGEHLYTTKTVFKY